MLTAITISQKKAHTVGQIINQSKAKQRTTRTVSKQWLAFLVPGTPLCGLSQDLNFPGPRFLRDNVVFREVEIHERKLRG